MTQEIILAGLAAIEAIIDALRNSQNGKIDATAVLSTIQALQDAIAANNAAADAALAARFPSDKPSA